MLYLTRKMGESIVINGEVLLTICEIKGEKYVKIGCVFPPNNTVLRKELYDKIAASNIKASAADFFEN